MRLSRFLAHAGVASRRKAEDVIRAGRVTVAGEIVDDPARDVAEGADVAVDGERVRPETTVVYAVHKPLGVVSTAKDTHGRPTVVELVPEHRRLYPVGRLDADTSGLILLTNDGDLAHALTHPRFEVPKTYLAKVDRGPVGRARCAGCARESSSRTAARPRPRPARGARTGSSSSCARVASGRCAGCARPWAIRCASCAASPSARCASATCARALTAACRTVSSPRCVARSVPERSLESAKPLTPVPG